MKVIISSELFHVYLRRTEWAIAVDSNVLKSYLPPVRLGFGFKRATAGGPGNPYKILISRNKSLVEIYECCPIFHAGKSILPYLRYLIFKIFRGSIPPDPLEELHPSCMPGFCYSVTAE